MNQHTRSMLCSLADHIEQQWRMPFAFVQHETCAMGFLADMLGLAPSIENNSFWASEVLEISQDAAIKLFVNAVWEGRNWPYSTITREVMCDQLRRVALSGEV